MIDILHYSFFQNALLGALLASVVCGIVGTYIVTRRLVFISGGITHASFGGIGLGVLMGINPILSAIAMFWTFGMSVGIICCFLSPGFMPDLPSFLFGSILTIGTLDLCLLGVLSVIVILCMVFFYREVLSVAFDRTFAESQGLPVRWIEYGMMALIALTIVSTLRMVGIVLALSLLTIPQMTANLFTLNYKRMMFLSIVIGWADCLFGLAMSYWLNVPSGASIIFFSIIVYAIAKLLLRK